MSKLFRVNGFTVLYLDYLLLSLKTDKIVPMGPSSISNLVSDHYGRFFPKNGLAAEKGELSNGSTGPIPYFYPRLQYKIIRGGPIIAAVNEGCSLLWDIYDKLEDLNDRDNGFKIIEKRLIEKKSLFGITDRLIKYRFLTPWLALPEENFKKYLLMDEEGRSKMLIKVLDGHIRSVSESLGYEIHEEINIKTNIKGNYIFQRDIHVAGLFGSFTANFEIPSFLGLGKSVSRGFGTIKQL